MRTVQDSSYPFSLPPGTGLPSFNFGLPGTAFRDPISQFIEPIYLPPAGKYHFSNGPFVVGDFNGDGLPDIAEVVFTDNAVKDNTVNILLNVGNGAFVQAASYNVPGVFGIIAADINGDGRLDLVTQNNFRTRTTVSVLLGAGDGTFAPPVSYGSGVYPQTIVAGDFNGDGHLDLIVGYRSNNGSLFTLLRGRGDGSFRIPQTLALPTAISISLVVGDFNDDGKLDLATQDYATGTGVDVFLGNGDGTFETPLLTSVGNQPRALAASDLNHDGHLDLVVADYGLTTPPTPGHVAVLLGNGDGTFSPAVYYTLERRPYRVVTGDLNGDGETDIVVVDEFGGLWVMFGSGDGKLQTPSTSYGVLASGPQDFFLADMNRAGKLDIVIPVGFSRYLFNTGVMFNNGDGTFDAPIEYYPTSWVRALAVGDFNGDGKLDVVTGGIIAPTTQTEFTTFLGKGDGRLPATQSASLLISGNLPNSLTPVDLNRDGKLDLVAETGAITSLLGNGDGTFRYVGTYDANIVALAVGDFNGDGIPDVVTIPYLSVTTANIWLGNGDGSFRAGPTVNLSEAPASALVADLNHDGKLDLVFGTSFSDVLVALGNGDGTFQANTTYTLPPYFVTPIVADFNNDGIPDIAYGGSNAFCDFLSHPYGWVGVMYGKGDGTFGPPHQQLSPISCGSLSISTADLNADGRPDLILASDGWGVAVFLNTGRGFEHWENYYDGFGPFADLNGDGAIDLVAPSYPGFSVALNASGVKVTRSSSLNPSAYGQPVTFSATVTPTHSPQGTPAGSVIFRDNSKMLGTVSLTSGVATFTTATLAPGSHNITASYLGDSVFVPLSSKPLTQIVKK